MTEIHSGIISSYLLPYLSQKDMKKARFLSKRFKRCVENTFIEADFPDSRQWQSKNPNITPIYMPHIKRAYIQPNHMKYFPGLVDMVISITSDIDDVVLPPNLRNLIVYLEEDHNDMGQYVGSEKLLKALRDHTFDLLFIRASSLKNSNQSPERRQKLASSFLTLRAETICIDGEFDIYFRGSPYVKNLVIVSHTLEHGEVIASRFPNLEYLHSELYHNGFYTNESIKALSMAGYECKIELENLETLIITPGTSSSLSEFTTNYESLKELIIMTDKEISLDNIRFFTNLKRLVVTCPISRSDFMDVVNLKGLESLCVNIDTQANLLVKKVYNMKLKELHLITDRAVDERLSMPELRSLTIQCNKTQNTKLASTFLRADGLPSLVEIRTSLDGIATYGYTTLAETKTIGTVTRRHALIYSNGKKYDGDNLLSEKIIGNGTEQFGCIIDTKYNRILEFINLLSYDNMATDNGETSYKGMLTPLCGPNKGRLFKTL